MKRWLTAIVLLVLAAVAHADPPRKIGRVMVTFYWVIDESGSRYRGKQDSVLHDAAGRLIARTSRRFKRDLVMEGTGWLKDGRTVMYDRKVGKENRFRIIGSRYGIGGTGCPLTPYRTIAIDPRYIKLGSTIYIPQLKGTHLPDGTIHDGIFVANDRGHFRGRHIDLFVGAGPRSARPFIRKGYGSRSHVSVYLVDEPKVPDCHP